LNNNGVLQPLAMHINSSWLKTIMAIAVKSGVLIILLLCLSLQRVSAAEESDDPDSSKSEAGLVDRTHSLVSESFNNFIYQIDDTISGGEPASSSRSNTARVRVDLFRRGGGETSLKGTIKIKAVLPRAEKRLRLLVNTEEDLKPQSNNAPESNTEGLSLALRFIKQARDNGLFNVDIGARWRDEKVQAFGRVNLSFDFFHSRHEPENSLSGRFHSKFSNRLYQYSSSGFENRFRYDLSKTLDNRDSLLLRASTDILWSDTRNGALITETLGLYTDIDDRRALALEALAGYSTRLNGEETELFRGSELRFRFRHNIFRKWFYYEFWPGISWLAENNYRQTFQGMFRIETVFGKF